MSSYLKNIDLDDYKTEEEFEDLYDEFEEQDKIKIAKRQTKIRKYEGYNDDDD